MTTTTRQFQSLYCQRFKCLPSEYEERMFRQCLYWHARLLAPVVRNLKSDFFMEDFKFIRNVAASVGMREVGVDLLAFRDVNLGKPSLLRTTLKIRVSGRKAAKLARRVFYEESPPLGKN